MTITSTPPRRPPPQTTPRLTPGTTSAARAIAIGLGTLLLASLLNAEALQDTARAQPFGWKRTAVLSLLRPLVSAGRTLGFDRPRRLLDGVVHPDAEPPGLAPIVPTPAPTPTPKVPAPAPTVTPPGPTPLRRHPTGAAPLRIWIGGDSMAQVFGGSLIEAASATGVARAKLEVRISSGLTRPDFFDWPDRLRGLLRAASPPEAVVFMVGANDAQGIRTADGSAPFGSTAWRAEYRSRVAATMDRLARQGLTVYWIGQPIMRSATFSARMLILDDIYRSEAARNGVRYVDSWALFADAHGRYTASLPDARGRPVLMRQSDGIHLTRAGGERLAKAVMKVIRSDWELKSR